MVSIIAFILILGLLVFVHELGHFVVARKNGVRCDEFGLGFPPRVCGFQKDSNGKLKFFWGRNAPLEEKIKDEETEKEGYVNNGDTVYSLNLIPLGGFVKIKGEMGENAEDVDSFASKSASKRSAILVAGVTMNVLLSAVLIIFGLMIGLPQAIDEDIPITAQVKNTRIQLNFVQPNSPADSAGLKMGDTLLSVDNKKFEDVDSVQKYINNKTGQDVEFLINRIGLNDKTEGVINQDGKFLLNIKTRVALASEVFPESKDNFGVVGVGLVKTGVVSFSWYEAIWRGVVLTGSLLKQMLFAFYDLFRELIINRKVTGDLAGPVGIAVITKEMTELGISYVIQFAAVLSINLAIINILPIPALDGGRILFIAIEKIRRKPMDQEIEAKIHNVVFVALLILIALITYRDIARYF